MRRVLVLIFLGLFAGIGWAQERVVQLFNAPGALTTPTFTVQDRWELRWDCPDVISVTLLAPDGSIVAGTSGSQKGSLFEPNGGTYYLQVSRTTQGSSSPWHVIVVELGASATNDEFFIPYNYTPPKTISGPVDTNGVVLPVPPTGSSKAASTGANTASSSASPTNAAPPAPAPRDLTLDQARAVVLIKGDVGEGTGFLVHTPDGPAVITNQHVIAANQNVKITTTSGAVIKVTGLKGASDRDLAMLLIQDDHYNYLDLDTDIKDTVQPGDDVITPGNSEGGEVMLNTKGTVLGIGPEKIEFSNPIYHGNSGGPVFHDKSGKVIAVVTQGMKVIPTDDLDKASAENKNSAITGSMRYFGLRPDTVPTWDVYDWNTFRAQTTFLKDYHEDSRCLDSYMNGARYEKEHLVNEGENGPPNSQYFLRNEKIVRIRDSVHSMAADADQSQNLEAWRQLVMDLEDLADKDKEAINNPANFYSFNETCAQQEIKYRNALRDEIERVGNKVSDMGH
jgi:hypothetical protein